jgi:hypothetical protein
MSGSALNGTDYVSVSGSVTIPGGQSSAPVLIDAIDDNLPELDEYVVIELQSGTGYTIEHEAALLAIEDIDITPGLVEDDIEVYLGDPLAISVFENDPGTHGGSLTIEDFSTPAHGTVTQSGSDTLVYTATSLSLHQADQFTYTVSNGLGGTAIAAVRVVWLANALGDNPTVVTDVGPVHGHRQSGDPACEYQPHESDSGRS